MDKRRTGKLARVNAKSMDEPSGSHYIRPLLWRYSTKKIYPCSKTEGEKEEMKKDVGKGGNVRVKE